MFIQFVCLDFSFSVESYLIEKRTTDFHLNWIP